MIATSGDQPILGFLRRPFHKRDQGLPAGLCLQLDLLERKGATEETSGNI
jgi:hypothetical protein